MFVASVSNTRSIDEIEAIVTPTLFCCQDNLSHFEIGTSDPTIRLTIGNIEARHLPACFLRGFSERSNEVEGFGINLDRAKSWLVFRAVFLLLPFLLIQ